jgi:hypothetical protein
MPDLFDERFTEIFSYENVIRSLRAANKTGSGAAMMSSFAHRLWRI